VPLSSRNWSEETRQVSSPLVPHPESHGSDGASAGCFKPADLRSCDTIDRAVILLVLAGIVVLVLGLLGIWVTLYPPESRKAKRWFLTAFGVLVLAAAAIEVIEKLQDQQDSEASSRTASETRGDVAAIRDQTSKPPTVKVTVAPATPQIVVREPKVQPIVLGLDKTTVDYRSELKMIVVTIYFKNFSDRLVAGTIKFDLRIDGRKAEFLEESTMTLDFPPNASRHIVLDGQVEIRDFEAVRANRSKIYVEATVDYHNGVEQVQYQFQGNTYPNANELDATKSITVSTSKQ